MSEHKKIVAVSSSGGHWAQLLRLWPALSGQQQRLMAVSSKGGHWSEMQRLAPAFAGHDVVYITTQKGADEQLKESRVYTVMDSNRWQKLKLLVTMLQVLFIILRERPEVVLSTGAAPGVFAMAFGKMMGAKTIWVESIANAEEPSLSARLVRRFADLYLTQWEHMARPEGPHYMGSVL